MRECQKVWLKTDGSIIERGEILVVNEDDPEEAAMLFMERLFNNDPEVTSSDCLIDGEIWSCEVESMPVFRAYRRDP